MVYAIRHPEIMLFDLDFILPNTYEHQEKESFNFHYQMHDYHPLLNYRRGRSPLSEVP